MCLFTFRQRLCQAMECRFNLNLTSHQILRFLLLDSGLFSLSSGHLIFIICLRQLLVKVWILCIVALVILHVSAPYNKTDFTLELIILCFVFFPVLFDFQIVFSWRNEALPISIIYTLLHQNLCLRSSQPYFPGKWNSQLLLKIRFRLELDLDCNDLSFRSLVFPLWILSPVLLDTSKSLVVLSCICCCLCDSNARSSANSK